MTCLHEPDVVCPDCPPPVREKHERDKRIRNIVEETRRKYLRGERT